MEDSEGLQHVEFSIDRGVWPVLRGQGRSVGVSSKDTHRIDPPIAVECPVLPQPQVSYDQSAVLHRYNSSRGRRHSLTVSRSNIISQRGDLFHYLQDPQCPVIVSIPGRSLAGNPKVGPTGKPDANERLPRNVRRVFHGTFDAEMLEMGGRFASPGATSAPCGDLGHTETQIWRTGRLVRFPLLIEYPSPLPRLFSCSRLLFCLPFPSLYLCEYLSCFDCTRSTCKAVNSTFQQPAQH
jgi:hypothetical protein